MVTTQTCGVILLAVAGALLWSPWSLVAAGLLLLVVPEVVSLLQRRRLARRVRDQFGPTPQRPGEFR